MAKAKIAVYLRLDPDLYEKAVELAKKKGLSLAAYTTVLLKAYVAQQGKS